MTAREVPAALLHAVEAVVFDTDGVLTDSARIHAEAWKEAFDLTLREHPPADPSLARPFDVSTDYPAHVDGKSRLDGATAFLRSREVPIPEGRAGEPAGTHSVAAVATLKDGMFTRRLRDGGIEPFPGSVRLLKALKEAGVPMAAASASRHAHDILDRAGLLAYFETVVDGGESARLGLPGKPDPALFLEAARRLGAEPANAAVVEDAQAGVEAGRRGGFGLVVGVDRIAGPGSARALRQHGADVVVADLADLLRAPGPPAPPGPSVAEPTATEPGGPDTRPGRETED
ncbi:beta-phosphoglucomutase family hydrolase [Streptomyces sp. NPDC049954]|uniref:HAD family hydrolase n=1 Tax=Streptomyces sp. NPDC049954 TaxID=3155779 RepID=UPI00341D0DF8